MSDNWGPSREEVVAAWPDHDREIEYRQQIAREAYERGQQAGHYAGREDAHAEMAAAWARVAGPASRPGPSHAELEERRWGPGGREHFSDPRPGDFQGRDGGWAGRGYTQRNAESAPEPDREAEAG